MILGPSPAWDDTGKAVTALGCGPVPIAGLLNGPDIGNVDNVIAVVVGGKRTVELAGIVLASSALIVIAADVVAEV